MCYMASVYFLRQVLCNILFRNLGNELLKWAAVSQICVCEMYFILKMVSLCLYNFDQPTNATIHIFNTTAKLVRVSFHLISGDHLIRVVWLRLPLLVGS